MKTKILFILTAFMLSFAGSTADAQHKYLKKVGKAIESGVKKELKNTNRKSSSSNNNNSNESSNTNNSTVTKNTSSSNSSQSRSYSSSSQSRSRNKRNTASSFPRTERTFTEGVVVFEDENNAGLDVEGLLYRLNLKNFTAYVDTVIEETYTYPLHVKIHESVLYRGKVYNVTRILGQVFRDQDITSIDLPNTITGMDKGLFRGAFLDSIVVPGSVERMGTNCLADSRLKKAVVKEGVQVLEASVFGRCDRLVSVSLPASVKSIDLDAFSSCPKLTTVTFPENAIITKIPSGCFDGCKSLASFTIPLSVTTINDYAFRQSGLKSLVIHENIKHIGDGAFEGIPITELTIPATVEKIGVHAFGGCKKLKKINISRKWKDDIYALVMMFGNDATHIFTNSQSLTDSPIFNWID